MAQQREAREAKQIELELLRKLESKAAHDVKRMKMELRKMKLQTLQKSIAFAKDRKNEKMAKKLEELLNSTLMKIFEEV